MRQSTRLRWRRGGWRDPCIVGDDLRGLEERGPACALRVEESLLCGSAVSLCITSMWRVGGVW